MRYKALKDCSWIVSIDNNPWGEMFYWNAWTHANTGVSFKLVCSDSGYKLKTGAKKSWEAFAKRNGFKHWKFI